MNLKKRYAWVCLALSGLVMNMANAADNPAADNPPPYCKQVKGRVVWTLLGIGPDSLAPFDPAGRVLGQATGDLKGATTSIIKSAAPKPDGSAVTNDLVVFVTGAGDVLWGDAVAAFTPIAGRAAIKDQQSITIKGGTGRWEGAVGTLTVEGEGIFLDPPKGQVVGNVVFDVGYTGNMCKAKFEDWWWN